MVLEVCLNTLSLMFKLHLKYSAGATFTDICSVSDGAPATQEIVDDDGEEGTSSPRNSE